LSSKNSKSVVGLIWGFLYARRDNAESGGTKGKQKKEGNGETMPSVAVRRRKRGAEAMNGGDLWHFAKY